MFRRHDRNAKTSKIVSIEEPLASLKRNLAADLTWTDFSVGLAIALLLGLSLVSYRYQATPSYKPGEIARSEIKAPQDMIIEDKAATQAARQDAARKMGAVFDYDPNILFSVQRDAIQEPFARARALLGTKARDLKKAGGAARGSQKVDQELLAQLKSDLGNTFPEDLIAILYRDGFSQRLEDQMASVLRTAMAGGVVGNRDLLQRYADSGIRLRNIASGRWDILSNLSSIKDVTQVRSTIRQNRFELPTMDPASRKEAVRYLEEIITPNVFFSPETDKRRQEAADNVSSVLRHVKRGKIIAREGDRITESALVELDTLKQLQQPRLVVLRFLAGLFLSVIFLYLVWHYLAYHQKRHTNIRAIFLLTSTVFFLSLAVMRIFLLVADILYEKINLQSIKDPTILYYAVPFTFGALLIALLADVRMAILFSLLFSMLVGLFTSNINLSCYVLIGSLVATYGIKQYRDRLAISKVGLIIGVVNVFIAPTLDLLTHSEINVTTLGIKTLCGLHNGIVSSMIASLFLPLLESLFKVTTDIKLIELSNLNTPILRRMAVEAPGTYHHSLVMGTLAEAAAEASGANALLVRVSAYYHDIGKLKKPDYFVENQIFTQNKHDKLSPSMSSLVISSHVKDGLEMAKKIGLMPRISDMIPQHHGTRLMTYFYEKAKTAAKGEPINPSDYRYPGPKPQSKEAAILMIADSVEATSRTLSDPTPTQIQGMIKRIIDTIVGDGQFDECDITTKDLSRIEGSMLHVLTGIFHHRIEYPGYDFSKKQEELVSSK